MREVEIYLNVTLGHAFLSYHEGDEMRCAWRGKLDLPDDDKQACHILWAFFQNPLGVMVESRQDEAWISEAQRLTGGYQDRSLSMGDVVTVDGRSYAVTTMDFDRVGLLTGDELVGPEGDRRLREQIEEVQNPRCPVCHKKLIVDDDNATVECEDQRTCGYKESGDRVREALANRFPRLEFPDV